MSGLHLVKQGRDRRRIDLQRDFTVASPAEFVTRFGGNKVIEKVMTAFLLVHNLNIHNIFDNTEERSTAYLVHSDMTVIKYS